MMPTSQGSLDTGDDLSVPNNYRTSNALDKSVLLQNMYRVGTLPLYPPQFPS